MFSYRNDYLLCSYLKEDEFCLIIVASVYFSERVAACFVAANDEVIAQQLLFSFYHC